MAFIPYINMGAVISADQRYRYLLWREWRGTHKHENWRWSSTEAGGWGEPKSCTFIMLNPSTADGSVDDATIRKCVGFAQRWSYERLVVINLFAYRATAPQAMLRLDHNANPVGPDNQRYFDRAIDTAGIIICAWGTYGSHLDQDKACLGWLYDKPRYALALTKDGHPRHPLYVPYSATPTRFRP